MSPAAGKKSVGDLLITSSSVVRTTRSYYHVGRDHGLWRWDGQSSWIDVKWPYGKAGDAYAVDSAGMLWRANPNEWFFYRLHPDDNTVDRIPAFSGEPLPWYYPVFTGLSIGADGSIWLSAWYSSPGLQTTDGPIFYADINQRVWQKADGAYTNLAVSAGDGHAVHIGTSNFNDYNVYGWDTVRWRNLGEKAISVAATGDGGQIWAVQPQFLVFYGPMVARINNAWVPVGDRAISVHAGHHAVWHITPQHTTFRRVGL